MFNPNFSKYVLTVLATAGITAGIMYHTAKDNTTQLENDLALSQSNLENVMLADSMDVVNKQTDAWKNAFLAPADSSGVVAFNYASGSAKNSAQIDINMEPCSPCEYKGVVRVATIAQDNATITGKITVNYNVSKK